VGLSVCSVSEAGFEAMANQWQACLANSNAHPLFMSWPWLYGWWETWSQVLGLELMLLGVYDENGELVGIGPFYRRDLVTPLGFRVRRLHLMGNAWHVSPTVRTEYCGLILRRDRAGEACQALIEAVGNWRWDEWILCDVLDTELQRLEQQGGSLWEETSGVYRLRDEGVRIDTRGDFSQWLAGLGRNTRLKVYNRRAYLHRQGDLECVCCDPAVDGDFLDRLNGFHQVRWGKPAFDEEALRFHRLLMARLPEWGGRVQCSVLRFNGDCVSVLYDLTVGGQRFNLQSGYQEDFDRRVALGFLHLGYAIEAAFNDPEVDCYDLLAGGGKNQYYKHHFRGQRVNFNTLQLVRNPALRFLYRQQRGLPSGWRRLINRWLRL